MGMAASQARFLQLTARKSNNEYMGQQINQSRTALANKSAGLFEKMLSLKPPVPPSSVDDKYYTQGYTFVDPSDDLRKKVTWQEFEDVDASEFSLTGNIQPGDYYTDVDGNTASPAIMAMDLSGDEILNAIQLVDEEAQSIFQNAATLADASTELANYLNYPAESLDGNAFEIPEDTYRIAIRYATLEHNSYDPEGNYQVVEEQIPAVLFFDNRERLLSFNELSFQPLTFDSYDTDVFNPGSDIVGGVPGTGTASDDPANITEDSIILSSPSMEIARVEMGDELSYSGQFDDASFNDDMNRYEFDKAAYDYQVERINLETKQLQQQDKSLELKLKQIDTDHSAIQTEMEAVQKVIDKNIETTFKTFA